MRRFLKPELLLILPPLLYVATMAHGLVLGDPTEYTFVANVLGIAHPPGYAFITLLGKLIQTLVPFGEIPWRMHLLSVLAATTAVILVYGTVRAYAAGLPGAPTQTGPRDAAVAGIFAALSLAFGADFWQHAIHTNPHIITATFLAANLFFLTRWWSLGGQGKQAERWLLLFSFSAGLGVTHHPLTVFSFPAYALFILAARPGIWRDGRLIGKMLALALLGLAVWLYFPIRSAMGPPFGPTGMNTLDGFLAHVLGRGITEALPYYALYEQGDRAIVFWSILRLQYTLPVIFLAAAGALWPIISWAATRFGRLTSFPAAGLPLLLFLLAFLCNYVFVISLKAQDIMAYILGLLLIVALLAGIGLYYLLEGVQRALRPGRTALTLFAVALFLIGPFVQMVRYLPRISLQDYNEGDAYVQAVFSEFAGRGEEAVLLNDWEHMTPLWYTQLVQGRWPDAADVRPEYVSTARPWVDFVYDFLPGGPVYLSNYRREVVDAGFRLRPYGPFYQVVEPGDRRLPSEFTELPAEAGAAVELVGYELPQDAVQVGDYVPLALAMRTAHGTDDYVVPVVRVGDLSFPFTTDSHLVSPEWQPGEVIVERFDLALPLDLAAGTYPVQAGLKNLSSDTEPTLFYQLGNLEVSATNAPAQAPALLANFRQRVGLVAAAARLGWKRYNAPWMSPIQVHPGDIIHLTLDWRSLAKAEESYTVFVHLIDEANRPIVALDYTPLGGAAPTHLWIPKWLPGQQYVDPYRLQIPPDLAPGTYLIEVGLYEMVGKRRLHLADEAGNLIGDRYILGPVVVSR